MVFPVEETALVSECISKSALHPAYVSPRSWSGPSLYPNQAWRRGSDGWEGHGEEHRARANLRPHVIPFARGFLDPEERKVTGANVERR